ncbi:hypothetical protein [Polaromonas sp. CG9_12]|nr:hypothetical protein [Polaromonas sp. CG9_12]
MRKPRIQGLPPRLPGSSVILFISNSISDLRKIDFASRLQKDAGHLKVNQSVAFAIRAQAAMKT